jgi:hypothetical protein
MHPLLDRAAIYVMNECRLTQCHHSSLCFTFGAPREKWARKATSDHNLVRFNGDPGSPLAQVPLPFQSLLAAPSVVDSDRSSDPSRPMLARIRKRGFLVERRVGFAAVELGRGA